MIPVTMKQWVILTFIRNYRQQHGVSPSSADIAQGCAIRSQYAAYRLLKKMRIAGVVSFGSKPKRARTLTLCNVEVAVTP